MELEQLDRKFGVVLFDNPEDPQSGWAAVAGGRGSRRIQGPHELSTDTIWWSNVPYEMFFGRTQTWRIPSMRHDKYLVVAPRDVLKEWGHDPTTVDASFVADFCAVSFDRIMRMSWMLLRDVNPKLRMDQAFLGKTLREDLRSLLPELDYPQGEAASVMKSGYAWEEFTATGARGPKGGKWIVLRKPRLSYAMEMLQTPVPRAPFEFVSRAELRNLSDDRVKFVREMKEPCIVEVSISSMQPEVSPLYGFGNATDKSKKVPRSWVAHPELVVLSRFAELEVRNAWRGREYWAMVPAMPEVVKDFFSDKYTEWSWTAGIIAETLWRSVILGEDKGKAGARREGEELAQTSWPGLWIRAADKASMFSVSLRLAELGYTVMSYGIGWVRLQVAEDEVAQVMKDGLSLGLIPQLADVPENVFRGTINWAGDPKAEPLATLTMRKAMKMLWNLDKVPTYPPEQRREAVREIQSRMQGKPA